MFPWTPRENYNSIFNIPFGRLRSEIDGIIFDADQTLVTWHGKILPSEIADLLLRLNTLGYKYCVLTNSTEERTKELQNIFGKIKVIRAYPSKPHSNGYLEVLEYLGTGKKTAVIGDRKFTDIWGGNRLELYTILVGRLSDIMPYEKSEPEPRRIGIMRFIEELF